VIPGLSRCAPLLAYVGEPGDASPSSLDPDSEGLQGEEVHEYLKLGAETLMLRWAAVAMLGWLGGVCADSLGESLAAPIEVRSFCVRTL